MALQAVTLRSLIICFCASIAAVSQAATLTNLNREKTSIIVIEGNSEKTLSLKPDEKLNFCTKGCVVRLGNNDDYNLAGDETIATEEGLMFLDRPEQN
jgi:hypothetical protein